MCCQSLKMVLGRDSGRASFKAVFPDGDRRENCHLFLGFLTRPFLVNITAVLVIIIASGIISHQRGLLLKV